MSDKTEAIKLLSQFRDLDNDVQRWRWVAKNQGKGFKVMLDNDSTWIEFDCSQGDELYADFDDYLGWSEGAFSLLKAIGVECESV